MTEEAVLDTYVRRSYSKKGPPEDFKYYDIRPNNENELNCNLTELNAARHFYDRGYMSHRDWNAHNGRYMHVSRYLGIETKSVLDVGCGKLDMPYSFLQHRQRPSEYWGIDLRAKEEWGKLVSWPIPTRLIKGDIVLDDFEAIDGWPQQGFDVVVCFEVFEHIPRSHGPILMQRLYDWTKPGGKCYFSTPNLGVSNSVAANHIGPDGEIREWTYDDKIALVEAVGFDILGTYGTFMKVRNIPEEVLENPVIKKMIKYHNPEIFSAAISAAFPAESNNSIFVMTRS